MCLGLYREAGMSAERLGLRLVERWVPVTRSGERWAPRRTREEAEAVRRASWPKTGRREWDGVVEIVHETRWVSEWEAS